MSSHFYNDQIPQGWEAAIIGVCIEIITPPSKINTIEYGESGKFPIIDQSQDFICGWTDDEKKVLKISEPVIIFGDHTCVTKFVNFDFAQGADGIKILKSKKFLNPKFLYQLLQFDPIVPEMYKRHFSKLKGKKILYPKDKAEQEMISQVLGDMDDLISAKCELLDKKRAIKQAAAQQLLTPKPYWHTATLGEIFTFLKGKGLSKEKLISNGKFKCILYGELYTTYNEVIDSIESSTNSEEGIKSKFDDLLIPASTTTSAIDLAKASVVLQCEILIGGDINILRKKRNDVSGKFMAYYLTSTKKIEIAQYAQGITIIHLYAKNLSDLEISYPSLLEQTKIAEILSDMDKEISALQDEIEKLKMIKQGVMGELLSGKIRLKG
nr:restriction endonuclease subunit S [uncultured Campylobacter sp.]